MGRSENKTTGAREHRPPTDLNRFGKQDVVLFDGVCNLCNSSVNFLIDRDRRGRFLFASLQSGFGQQLLAHENIGGTDLKSIMLITGGQIFTRSSAILRIARHMPAGWPLLFGFIIIPRFFRDALYDFIARNRYRWFGRREVCRVPTAELKARFLE